ncbi:hypothetical protein BaRGS_00001391 [Batillaria attramentaria]|uniref:Clavaminate synthase-like protein n=1 Tax=Batillaria attramentaria TaxID=370345 RepID=A0ABD0M7M7_9CAEN
MEAASTCGKRLEQVKKLTDQLIALRKSALKGGVNDEQLRETLEESSPASGTGTFAVLRHGFVGRLTNPSHRVHLIVALGGVLSVALLVGNYELVRDYIRRTPCLVDFGIFTEEIFRPLVDCEMCRKLNAVAIERNLSQETFVEKYAYSGIPVLVKEGIVNWSAMSVFSFKFFQGLYRLTGRRANCHFFAYNTEFTTLTDALNGMSDERASCQPGEKPWYFGWSNCHAGVQEQLRKHFQLPDFLPANTEGTPMDWIFMGSPGPGAPLHIDTVERPSWQAQVSGRKTWQLVPSAECEAVCHSFNVTVEKGDIIFVETNMWYHSTFVHPGEISIAIGSEIV